MAQLVRADTVEAHDRLSQLGLTLAVLSEALVQGYLQRARLTSNHPRIFFGYAMWAETVAALRENLRPLGWFKSDDDNFELTIHGDRALAISVTTGDEATGLAHLEPSNKCPKGINTIDAIAANNQRDMFAEYLPPIQETSGFTTWVLLFHLADGELRSELSQPSEIINGKIKAWKERIVLPAISLNSPDVPVAPAEAQDVIVDVRRRE